MITLLGSLIGFISAALPDLIRLLKDRQDKKHELAIIEMQLKQQLQGHMNQLEEINAKADILEARELYRTYNTGIRWVDALNGTVRPVIAYAFFFLYTYIKITQVSVDTPWLLWTEEDQAIFAGIISFYFGQRAMGKVRKVSY